MYIPKTGAVVWVADYDPPIDRRRTSDVLLTSVVLSQYTYGLNWSQAEYEADFSRFVIVHTQQTSDRQTTDNGCVANFGRFVAIHIQLSLIAN